jgi:shikimate kinase
MSLPREPEKIPPPAPIVALTGFMAAGKSTVGRTLWSLLHWRFIDLDCEIECRSKLRIHEIFALHGESRFREMETDALRGVLESASTSTVIALGGGTFVQPRNAELLSAAGAEVVFLELDILELLRRCQAAMAHFPEQPRPLAADSEAFCALYLRRLPHYRNAKLILNTANKTVDQTAREIIERLHLCNRTRQHQ